MQSQRDTVGRPIEALQTTRELCRRFIFWLPLFLNSPVSNLIKRHLSSGEKPSILAEGSRQEVSFPWRMGMS